MISMPTAYCHRVVMCMHALMGMVRWDGIPGIVARGKAASMLTALNNEDPMPLRVAKITQEAALRRVEKEQKHAMVKTIDAANKTGGCDGCWVGT